MWHLGVLRKFKSLIVDVKVQLWAARERVGEKSGGVPAGSGRPSGLGAMERLPPSEVVGPSVRLASLATWL